MKTIKKFVSVLLSGLMLFTVCSSAAYAENDSQAILDTDAFKTNYPYIFVHGMGGWGTSNSFYDDSPYWGGGLSNNPESDMIKILNENGVEAYAPSVGPLSSAWDRACELYAQLTGSQIRCPITQTPLHMTCLLTMRWS